MTEDGIPTIYKAALVALSIFSSNDLFGILLILKNLGWAFQASFEKFYPKKKKLRVNYLFQWIALHFYLYQKILWLHLHKLPNE